MGDIDGIGIGKSDFISVIGEARVNGGRVCIVGRFNSKEAEKEALGNGFEDAGKCSGSTTICTVMSIHAG